MDTRTGVDGDDLTAVYICLSVTPRVSLRGGMGTIHSSREVGIAKRGAVMWLGAPQVPVHALHAL